MKAAALFTLFFGLLAITVTTVAAEERATARLADAKVGTAKTELKAQIRHSGHVIMFFSATGRGNWLIHRRHRSCETVVGMRRQPVCRRARRIDRAHRWLRVVAERRYEALHAPRDPAAAICLVFGPYCSQALAVARCESNYYVGAQNGQYLGLFQMGDYARSTYGHGWTALEQARAAYRYFVDSGRDWSPWACKP